MALFPWWLLPWSLSWQSTIFQNTVFLRLPATDPRQKKEPTKSGKLSQTFGVFPHQNRRTWRRQRRSKLFLLYKSRRENSVASAPDRITGFSNFCLNKTHLETLQIIECKVSIQLLQSPVFCVFAFTHTWIWPRSGFMKKTFAGLFSKSRSNLNPANVLGSSIADSEQIISRSQTLISWIWLSWWLMKWTNSPNCIGLIEGCLKMPKTAPTLLSTQISFLVIGANAHFSTPTRKRTVLPQVHQDYY